jgi:hypothetical protein
MLRGKLFARRQLRALIFQDEGRRRSHSSIVLQRVGTMLIPDSLDADEADALLKDRSRGT